jgi:hypothetical protein
MATRAEKAQAALAAREIKHQQWLKLVEYIYPRIVAALKYTDSNLDYLLPSKYDIELTGRECRDRFGTVGLNIISRLFIRWQTKSMTRFGPRKPRWRLNIHLVYLFNDWIISQNGRQILPKEALDYLKSINAEELRRIALREEDGSLTLKHSLLTKEEHSTLLSTSLRQSRRAWAYKIYQPKPKPEPQLG